MSKSNIFNGYGKIIAIIVGLLSVIGVAITWGVSYNTLYNKANEGVKAKALADRNHDCITKIEMQIKSINDSQKEVHLEQMIIRESQIKAQITQTKILTEQEHINELIKEIKTLLKGGPK